MEKDKVKSNFAFELLGRISSYLDPKKVAIILALAVVSGLLGLLLGSIFVDNEYKTSMTLAMVSRTSQSKTQNLSDSHHVADVMQALYDNDSVVSATLSELKSDMTHAQFVKRINVEREEKTVLVKIDYTDTSKENAVKGINVYVKNLTGALKQNLGYDCFRIMVPATQPKVINHTLTVVWVMVILELAIALLWVVIRVFPGVIIITGRDLNDFTQPVLGEVFSSPKTEGEEDGQEEENDEQ